MEQYQLEKIVYEKWYIDLPKLFDFCNIYGKENAKCVAYLIEKVFSLRQTSKQGDILSDFYNLMKTIEQDFMMSHIKSIRDKVRIDLSLNNEKCIDVEEKLMALTQIYDTVTNISVIIRYFPHNQ